MLNFLRSRYTESETRKRRLKTEKLYNKWLREESNLGGSANMMSSNLTLCFADVPEKKLKGIVH